jgi:DNA mismatch repair protein MutS
MKAEDINLFKQLSIPEPTPMLQQYLSVKDRHKEYLLFYRMGDFYELFFDDAIKAAEILGIVLTTRGKHLEQDIPMCGVPAHSYESYLEKLIKSGFKVAICEQLESPEEAKKRGYKAVVKRDVVRIITPGTIIEENLLNAKTQNNLISIYFKEGYAYISAADITTGNFHLIKSLLNSLNQDLTRIQPKEIILSEDCYAISGIRNALAEFKSILSIRAKVLFDVKRAGLKIKNFYKLHNVASIGDLEQGFIISIGSLIEYIEHTHKHNLPRLDKPKKLEQTHFMMIDSSTRKNLEIDISLAGNRKKSLLAIIDKTITAQGGRLLSTYIMNPLINPIAIDKRLDTVEFFVKFGNIRSVIRDYLKVIPDLERILGRIYTKKAGPRDLGLVLQGLDFSFKISELLKSKNNELPDTLKTCLAQLCNYGETLDILSKALSEHLPIKIVNGKFIKTSFNHRLDQLYNLKDNSNDTINKLRDTYRNKTGVNSLKIVFNKILGYFIEVTPSYASKIDTNYFKHRQTLGSSVRYGTEELRKIELELLDCNEKISHLESELFLEICQTIEKTSENIAAAAASLAVIDLASSFAELAVQMNYIRPLVDYSNNFIIESGRHPMVENNAHNKFIPNSCSLESSSYIWLITGPNMAGKSTFLRQNAIIAIMAQSGSFVPAMKAHIGSIDKLFSRIGAADDISQGSSTFMVEMLETSNILNNATSRSFVILDEVGRGTSTDDGLAIAWSVLENLHNTIGCRTLFATHFHELTDLENNLRYLSCYTVKVRQWDGKVIFMHEVIKGKADCSYGIHVAEIAGLPDNVIIRANEILKGLQDKKAS